LNSIFSNIAKDSLIYGLARASNRFVSILLVPMYTRIFSSAQYGVIDLIGAVFSFLGLIINLGLSEALFFFFYNYKEKGFGTEKKLNGTILIFKIFLNFIVSATFILFSEELSLLLFDSDNYQRLIIMSSITTFFANLNGFFSTIFRLNKQPIIYLKVHLLTLFLSVLLSIYFVLILKLGLNGAFLASLISTIISFIISIFYAYRYLNFKIEIKLLIMCLQYGIPLVPGALSIWIMNISNRFFINNYCSIEDLGLYSISFKIAALIGFITFALRMALGPILFELASKASDNDPRGIYFEIFNRYLAILCFMTISLSLFSIELLKIFTTPEYYSAEKIVYFLCIANVGYGLAQITSLGIVLTKNTKFESLSNMLGALLSVILNFILIPEYGLHGAAVSSAISILFINISLYFFSNKFYNLNFKFNLLTKLFIFSVLTYIISRYLIELSLINIIFKISIIICYMILVRLLGLFNLTMLDTN